MNKIKQQFSQLRSTTPKYIQWLLLAAAFIVVLILLTMLMTGKKKAPVDDTDSVPVVVSLSDSEIDWSDVTVGEKKTHTIKITTTAPAIVSVRQAKEIDGFKPLNTCQKIGEITPEIPCTITLNYAPTHAAQPTGAALFVDWRGADMPEKMNETQKITVVLGATQAPAAKPADAPSKTPEPQPEPQPEPAPEPKPEPQPIKAEIKQEIEAIAPSDPFVFDDDPNFAAQIEPEKPAKPAAAQKAPAAKKATTVADTAPAYTPAAETCSDFAFPGYDMSGNQIGWIRPERGAYYFHPFSDKNCDTPTGIYNQDNGIITDINSPGKKIGTDAEHIGHAVITSGTIPQLSNAPRNRNVIRATQDEGAVYATGSAARIGGDGTFGGIKEAPQTDVIYGTTGEVVGSTQPYDRTFILRQYKPIPATIVSDVRADVALEGDNLHFPVRATVDRNVYSDNGRTIIIPTGTLLLGYVTGEVPGPYKSIGRMNIKWYQFVLPNGVEFNFHSDEPVSADSQGRIGVPGRGTTDYLEQFVMPMLTAIVPAAVNMIAPVADKFVNQIDLDNNTVVQSGTLRSSELAKNEIITAWNQVAQKLMVDMMDNTTPPFTIPAGTRITVYSPKDLAVLCPGTGKACDMQIPVENQRATPQWDKAYANYNDGSWIGQSRSFNMGTYCTQDSNQIWSVDNSKTQEIMQSGYSYSTVVAYCQSLNYKAINNVRQDALFQNQQSADNTNSIAHIGGGGNVNNLSTQYNENILGLKYADDDKNTLLNPFDMPKEEAPAAPALTCENGTNPDANGCCTGEVYTDLGGEFACCPQTGGDCFPPIL